MKCGARTGGSGKEGEIGAGERRWLGCGVERENRFEARRRGRAALWQPMPPPRLPRRRAGYGLWLRPSSKFGKVAAVAERKSVAARGQRTAKLGENDEIGLTW